MKKILCVLVCALLLIASVGALAEGEIIGVSMPGLGTSRRTRGNADDLMEGISNIWIVRRNMPSKDSVPFMVETLW